MTCNTSPHPIVEEIFFKTKFMPLTQFSYPVPNRITTHKWDVCPSLSSQPRTTAQFETLRYFLDGKTNFPTRIYPDVLDLAPKQSVLLIKNQLHASLNVNCCTFSWAQALSYNSLSRFNENLGNRFYPIHKCHLCNRCWWDNYCNCYKDPQHLNLL